jgi:hypothetical protein
VLLAAELAEKGRPPWALLDAGGGSRMKAEHRKELQTNELADRVGRALQGMKEGPSRGTWVALGLVALVLVLYFVWNVVKQHSETTNSTLWERWSSLASPEQLETFAKESPDSVPGRLARFRLARLGLTQGVANLGNATQRNQAIDQVRRAQELYEQLAGETANQPILQQEALLNSGKALETLGDNDRAKDMYNRVKRDYPNTPAAREADENLKLLETNAKDAELLKQMVQQKDKAPTP